MAEISLTVGHPAGLHARPAAVFVRTAGVFDASIRVSNDTQDPDRWADAKSILSVLTLGVSAGHRIRVVADGADADEAVAALEGLVSSGFETAPT